jgi:hypothetical protein
MSDGKLVSIEPRSGFLGRLEWKFPLFLVVVFGLLVPYLYNIGWYGIEDVNMWGRYMCFALIAIGLDLVWGYTGMLSLCQALFFSLGGYAMGMYLAHHGGPEGSVDAAGWKMPGCLFVVYPGKVGETESDWLVPWFWKPFWWLGSTAVLSIVIPGLVAGVVGFLVFRSRVKGVFFAILTQALTVMAVSIFMVNDMKLGGTNGMTNFDRIVFGGQEQIEIILKEKELAKASLTLEDIKSVVEKHQADKRRDGESPAPGGSLEDADAWSCPKHAYDKKVYTRKVQPGKCLKPLFWYCSKHTDRRINSPGECSRTVAFYCKEHTYVRLEQQRTEICPDAGCELGLVAEACALVLLEGDKCQETLRKGRALLSTPEMGVNINKDYMDLVISWGWSFEGHPEGCGGVEVWRVRSERGCSQVEPLSHHSRVIDPCLPDVPLHCQLEDGACPGGHPRQRRPSAVLGLQALQVQDGGLLLLRGDRRARRHDVRPADGHLHAAQYGAPEVDPGGRLGRCWRERNPLGSGDRRAGGELRLQFPDQSDS